MAALLKEASISTIKKLEAGKEPIISTEDFEYALHKTYPSVAIADRKLYENMRNNLKLTRGRLDSTNQQ